MAISIPQGDLARVVSQEPNTDWPHSVEFRVGWMTKSGRVVYRIETITAQEFFGSNSAPISGDRLLSAIERLRRQGAPMRKSYIDPKQKPTTGRKGTR